jgi:hypothetical protein
MQEGKTFNYYPKYPMTDKKIHYLKYVTNEAGEGIIEVWHWDDEIESFRRFSDRQVATVIAHDWRVELYFQGLGSLNKTFAKNPYSAELNAELPKFCDFSYSKPRLERITIAGSGFPGAVLVPKYTSGFKEEVKQSNYEYWLDFLEGNPNDNVSIAQFNVNNIGRRTKVVTDSNSNCLFACSNPTYVLIEANGDVREQLKIAESKNQQVIQVSPEIFNNLVLGGSRNAAYDKVRELLYQFTSFNESISLSVVPIYYLEPNTRITVHDNETGVHGDYLIKSISLPLTTNGTSSISATRCLERTF